MNLNIFKTIGSYLGKTKSFAPRVASSARIASAKGSELERTQLAQDLNNKLFKLMDDVFERKIASGKAPELTQKEFKTCLNEVAPGLDLRMSNKKYARIDAYVGYRLDKSGKTIVGYDLGLKGPIKKGVNTTDLRHEMRHVFDRATQHKMLARHNTESLIGRLKNYNKAKDMQHSSFYSGDLYSKRILDDDKTQVTALAEMIEGHFKKLKTSSPEKIEVLQKWRHSLKTELNAHIDQSKFACRNTGNSNRYFNILYGDYRFEPKIKLIENILKDEIASVRKLNAKKHGLNSLV